MGNIVQLSNDEKSWNLLSETIHGYYSERGRIVSVFSAPAPSKNSPLEFCFLIDRKYVAKYTIGWDRSYLGVIQLAIGPHYFSAADFWDYPNHERFSIEASTEAVERNLSLIDEFLGYVPLGSNGSLDDWLNRKR
jgi:hypothetical protein